MKKEEVTIELYVKSQKATTTLCVEKLSDNRFRMTDNAILNCCLTLGTEFETSINKDGKHEVTRIVKESEFITRRFFLSSKYKDSDYRMLGDELVKRGGFWQVDFGGIVTLNLPKDLKLEVNKIMKTLDLNLTEIIE